eukprot:6471849-Amphidinium_carterae.2
MTSAQQFSPTPPTLLDDEAEAEIVQVCSKPKLSLPSSNIHTTAGQSKSGRGTTLPTVAPPSGPPPKASEAASSGLEAEPTMHQLLAAINGVSTKVDHNANTLHEELRRVSRAQEVHDTRLTDVEKLASDALNMAKEAKEAASAAASASAQAASSAAAASATSAGRGRAQAPARRDRSSPNTPFPQATPLLVFGGWPRDTRKSVAQQDMDKLITTLEATVPGIGNHKYWIPYAKTSIARMQVPNKETGETIIDALKANEHMHLHGNRAWASWQAPLEVRRFKARVANVLEAIKSAWNAKHMPVQTPPHLEACSSTGKIWLFQGDAATAEDTVIATIGYEDLNVKFHALEKIGLDVASVEACLM